MHGTRNIKLSSFSWQGEELLAYQKEVCLTDLFSYEGKSSPVTGHADPEGSREVKTPRFLDNGTVWW